MLDIKAICDNPDEYDAGWRARGFEPHAATLTDLNNQRKEIVTSLQHLQAQRNASSKQIGKAKGSGDEKRAEELMQEVASIRDEIQNGERQQREIDQKLSDLLSVLPNIPFPDVPEGPDEESNVELRREGAPPDFAFTPKEHYELGEALGYMDFETAAKMSGSRFVVLKGALARLERALAHFMLDIHTGEFGYTEVIPPLLVRDDAVYGTAQLPKAAEDMFRTENGYWLVPTSEVSLSNLVRESILDEEELPLRFTAYTPCFRSEAGAAGKDTRGMIRQHQFTKVELVSVTRPEEAEQEHARMTSCAEEILKRLGLAYRVVLLSSGDMSFQARKTIDLEVWLPGQGTYREISSISNCGDFQARRMGARFRPIDAKGTEFVHTMNGSGLAIGRTMVAILENYQNEDGSVTIPQALRPYMGNMERIEQQTSDA